MADDEIFNPYLPVPPPNNQPDKKEPTPAHKDTTPPQTDPLGNDGVFNPFIRLPDPAPPTDQKEPVVEPEKTTGQQDAKATSPAADHPPAANHQMELAQKMAGESVGLVREALVQSIR